MMELKQVAESISLVTDVRTVSHKSAKDHLENSSRVEFEVFFEENVSDGPAWIPESVMNYLNSLRECSLFDIYPISAKCSSPYVSHNVAGFDAIQSKREGVPLPREKSTAEWMKARFLIHSLAKGEGKGKLKAEMKDKYKFCHHCKSLLPNAFLVRCNYRSGLMGAPVSSAAQEQLRSFFSKSKAQISLKTF